MYHRIRSSARPFQPVGGWPTPKKYKKVYVLKVYLPNPIEFLYFFIPLLVFTSFRDSAKSCFFGRFRRFWATLIFFEILGENLVSKFYFENFENSFWLLFKTVWKLLKYQVLDNLNCFWPSSSFYSPLNPQLKVQKKKHFSVSTCS